MDYVNLTAEQIAKLKETTSTVTTNDDFDFERNELEKIIDEMKKCIDEECLKICKNTGCSPEDAIKELHSLLQEQIDQDKLNLIREVYIYDR